MGWLLLLVAMLDYEVVCESGDGFVVLVDCWLVSWYLAAGRLPVVSAAKVAAL